jgi:hypothetical protein
MALTVIPRSASVSHQVARDNDVAYNPPIRLNLVSARTIRPSLLSSFDHGVRR